VRPGSWLAYGLGLVGVALVTVAIGLAGQWTNPESELPLYLIVVLGVAALWGRGPALAAALGAFLASELFLANQTAAGPLTDPTGWLWLLPFLLTALVTGQLAAALRRQAEAAGEREREAVALYEVVRQVPGSTLELRPLLSLILDQLGTLVPYRAAELIAIEGDEAVVIDYRGPLPRERVVGHRLSRDGALRELVDDVVRRRGPVVVDDLAGPSLLARELAATGELPADAARIDRVGGELSVPLMVKGEVIGVQTLLHTGVGYYTERHAGLATAFAQQAGAAIENARLYEEARGRAALEERQRLARELHDSVSQALYGIVLNASTAHAVRQVDPPQLADLLNDIVALAEAGLAEMRALIFELRPESLQEEGLVAALEKQAAAVQARRGITVRTALADEPDAPLAVKEVLYRIAQEALHNTVRHARAHTVDLTLEQGPGELELRVADDGRGFDPDGDFPGHLGLRSMRERATALGGTLELESAPGQGTRLRARIPLPAAR
jgi:signal transduction histidine kinase